MISEVICEVICEVISEVISEVICEVISAGTTTVSRARSDVGGLSIAANPFLKYRVRATRISERSMSR